MDRITDLYIEPRIGGWAVLAEQAEDAGPVTHVMESGLSLERAYRILEWVNAMGRSFPVAEETASGQPALDLPAPDSPASESNDNRPLLCA